MAGNEVAVCRFIFLNLKQISLKHLGQLRVIAAPLGKGGDRPLLEVLDDVVDKISKVQTGPRDLPVTPVVVKHVTIE